MFREREWMSQFHIQMSFNVEAKSQYNNNINEWAYCTILPVILVPDSVVQLIVFEFGLLALFLQSVDIVESYHLITWISVILALLWYAYWLERAAHESSLPTHFMYNFSSSGFNWIMTVCNFTLRLIMTATQTALVRMNGFYLQNLSNWNVDIFRTVFAVQFQILFRVVVNELRV